MKERVQKLMAQANLGSRRACEEIIRQGRVRVNGQVIHLGDQADPYADVIEVDGEKLVFPDSKIYIAFNKPKGVVSTDEPFENDPRRKVRDFIPHEGHLFSVGRLDADSEGLMVLTNDGDLANRLTHPRFRHSKTYKVVVRGLPTTETIERWERGVRLLEEDGTSFVTAPCQVRIVDGGRETTLRIVMTEGRKRQIRRVAQELNHPVITLVRTHIGGLALGALRPGEWRELEPKDLAALKRRTEDAKPSRRSAGGSSRTKPGREQSRDGGQDQTRGRPSVGGPRRKNSPGGSSPARRGRPADSKRRPGALDRRSGGRRGEPKG